jgi:hypothetical protein
MADTYKDVKQLEKQVKNSKQSKVISQQGRHRIEDIHEKRRLEKALASFS